MKLVTIYPIKTLKNNNFIENTSFLYKLWYIMVATTIVRFKYYHAWLWADAVCNNSGLGWYIDFGHTITPKWDYLTNINIFAFEVIIKI